MIYFHKRAGMRVVLAASAALMAAFACADLKIVSTVTVAGKRGPQSVTAITYLKGSLIRIDNGSISRITDSKSHKTILLNRDKKVYGVTDTKAAMAQVAKSVESQHMMITAHIRPTGKSKKIDGRTAHEYAGDLSVNGAYPPVPGSKASVTFQIDEWTTIEPGISVSQADMMGTISDLMHSLGGVAGMQKVTTELAKIKGIPLDTHLAGTFTIYLPNGGAPRTQKLTYDTTATHVTQETLPMNVFSVPKDFKREDMTAKKQAK